MRNILVASFLIALATNHGSAAVVSGKVDVTEKSPARVEDSGVVIALEPLDRTPDLTPLPPQSMAHKSKTFLPHILAITVGTKVSFPNRDPFFHNAFSNYDGQMFDIGMHPPGSTREVTFRRPGVVRIFCNIHPTMSSVILVLSTPYFAMSDANGNYRFPDVPAGEYRMRAFHERILPEDLQALERKVTIADKDVVLPLLTLPSAGYLSMPHKNKYGKEYPPVTKDVYPGQSQ